MSTPNTINNVAARRLFLGAQGLLCAPLDSLDLRELVQFLGFVQLDTINTVARAHDLILWSRLASYNPSRLSQALEERELFEHWTHDASIIPLRFFAHWKPRFRRDAARLRETPWWRTLLGKNADQVLDHVRERITAEGPLRSADFEHPEKRGPWWGWKPQKAALDYLWRSGELMVRGRIHFQKIYDLSERVHPEAVMLPEPTPEAHLTWACETAAERLVLFTPKELSAFWGAIDLSSAKRWCEASVKAGRLQQVQVEPADPDTAMPQAAFALIDWEKRLEALPEPSPLVRLLCPFDPVLRDRARCLHRFGFDYRFEAFVPENQRVYGYYVLPILEGDRLIGRLDPKLDRERGVLQIRQVWWEPGIRATKIRKAALAAEVERLAAFVGAQKVSGRPSRGASSS